MGLQGAVKRCSAVLALAAVVLASPLGRTYGPGAANVAEASAQTTSAQTVSGRAAPVQTSTSGAVVDIRGDGRWGPVEDWPLIGIHSVLTADGDVVTYGSDGNGIQTGRFSYDVWTPGPSASSGHATMANTTETDLFCNLQLNRSDTGEVLLFGGDNWTGEATNNLGNPDIISFDPATESLRTLPGMNLPRWYGTGTTLPDGSIFVQGGVGGEATPERWSPTTGSELLDLSTAGLDYWYPRNFVIPDGRLFGYDVFGHMYYVSADLGSLTHVG